MLPQLIQKSQRKPDCLVACWLRIWCREGDLNSYGVSPTWPSTMRVCQFRHPGWVVQIDKCLPLAQLYAAEPERRELYGERGD